MAKPKKLSSKQKKEIRKISKDNNAGEGWWTADELLWGIKGRQPDA